MSLFPMFMKLEGRPCLVVGAGAIGEPKIDSLLTSGASVRVIAPSASPAVAEWARDGSILWEAREFNNSDLDGVFLVIAATSSRQVNGAIFREAQQRNILCNVVDDPEYCDFYYPAVVRRGDLQLAISTNRPQSRTGPKNQARTGGSIWTGVRRMAGGVGKDPTAAFRQ